MTAATNALDILAEVRRHGGDVRVSGPDRLKVLAPPALLPDLVAKVRAVKPDLLAALADADAESKDWQARHAEALAFWRGLYPANEAACVAWGEMECRWHRLHGARVAPSICAGCGEPIRAADTMPLGNGARVHVTTLDCLIAYGARWRGEALAALMSLGLEPPPRTSEADE